MGVNLLALARYTLKGPFQAATVVGLLAVLAVFVPPFIGFTFFSLVLASIAFILATILVGLIILTQGSVSGLKVIGISIFGVTLAAWIVLNAPEDGILIGLTYWLPVVILAQTLRSTNSLALTLLAGVLFGIVAISLQYLFWDDVERYWISRLAQSQEVTSPLSQENREQFVLILQSVGLAFVSSMYLLFSLVLLAARGLQASLANSDGFGKEFRALAFGKPAATFALILLLLFIFWIRQPWMISLVILLAVALMFQGLAVVHEKLLGKKKRVLLLVLLYLALIFLSQIAVPLISFVGMVDNWVVFRKKSGNSNDVNIN